MRHFFEKLSWQALLTPILFILTGAALAVWPQSSIKIICTAASLFMIGLGAICLYCYFRGRDDLFSGHVNLLCGILVISIAFWIITRSNYFLSLLPILAGVTVIVHGLVDLRQALLLRQSRKNNWWITLIIAAAALCLGVIMLVNPFDTLVAIMIFIGIVLIAIGLSDLFVLAQGSILSSSEKKNRSARKRSAHTSAEKKRAPRHSRRSEKTSESSSPMQDFKDIEASEDTAEYLPEETILSSAETENTASDKKKSRKKTSARSEKSSRMAKLEQILGSQPEEETSSSESFPSSSAASDFDEDDEDDFWDEEEWDNL